MLYKFQSTHPRGVRLWGIGKPLQIFKVSIHAPARGATVTRSVWPDRSKGFNPRTREGCDKAKESQCLVVIDVSIHAPARGATIPIGLIQMGF